MQDEEINDYKFFCFDGKVRALYITSGRGSQSGLRADYFTRDFERIDLRVELPNSSIQYTKPVFFEDMIQIAEKLSNGIPEVRVDLYYTNHQIYFGEMTFFDGGGFAKFDPPIWDKKFGDWIDIESVKINCK